MLRRRCVLKGEISYLWSGRSGIEVIKFLEVESAYILTWGKVRTFFEVKVCDILGSND